MEKESLRKAAILIAALEPRLADALLEQMPPEQAQRVRNMLLQLGDVDADEQRRIVREFMRGKSSPAIPAGVELEASLASKLAEATTADSDADGDAPPAVTNPLPLHRTSPFAYLQQVPPRTLATYLLREHPQTMAVVLAHLPPPLAGRVLACLPHKLQAAVLHRVAYLDPMSPEILQELDQQLQGFFCGQAGTGYRPLAGLAAVQAILQTVPENQQGLLLSLSHRDRHLAAELAAERYGAEAADSIGSSEAADTETAAPPSSDLGGQTVLPSSPLSEDPAPPDEPPFAFADLASLSDRELAAILQAAPPQVTILALAGAPPALVERILRQLPSRQARPLRQKMLQLQPLRLADVDEAQRAIVQIALELVQQRKIPWPNSHRLAAAA